MIFVLKFKEFFRHLFHPQRSNNHRPKLLHPEAFFLMALVLGSLLILINNLAQVEIFSKILGFASSISPEQVVELSNQERAKLGLKPLIINQKLTAAALAKGQDMFNDQYWAHIAPDGKQPWDFMKENGYSYVVAGENLARDFSDTSSMMQAWMNSPTHKANIISPKYEEIGIAVIDGHLQGTETTLVVQMFGNAGSKQVAQIPKQAETAITQPEVKGESLQEPEAGAAGELEQRFVYDEEKPSNAGVLSSMLIPAADLKESPLFSPLQLSKAFIILVVIMIVFTLVYDFIIIEHRQSMRVVGKNLAHVFLLLAVSFLVLFFKSGIVG